MYVGCMIELLLCSIKWVVFMFVIVVDFVRKEYNVKLLLICVLCGFNV